MGERVVVEAPLFAGHRERIGARVCLERRFDLSGDDGDIGWRVVVKGVWANKNDYVFVCGNKSIVQVFELSWFSHTPGWGARLFRAKIICRRGCTVRSKHVSLAIIRCLSGRGFSELARTDVYPFSPSASGALPNLPVKW